MSDGLSWAYEQQKLEEDYSKHKASGKFSKEYLEQDIVRLLTKDDMRLLVVRLIIHHLGGFKKFVVAESYGFMELFLSMTAKEQKNFITRRSKELGMEVGYSSKINRLRKNLRKLSESLS